MFAQSQFGSMNQVPATGVMNTSTMPPVMQAMPTQPVMMPMQTGQQLPAWNPNGFGAPGTVPMTGLGLVAPTA